MPETLIEEARRRNVELESVNGRNLEAIDRFGWAVIMVGPGGEGEQFAPFAYTIGLSRLDSPEVIIVGVELRRAGWILNHVGIIARDSGGIDNGPLPGVLSGDYVLDLREMSALHHDAYLGRLLWFHEHFGTGGLRVLQAVWPDNLGRYPDDSRLTDEERARFVQEQPLLDRAWD